jgi:hypothetical protein
MSNRFDKALREIREYAKLRRIKDPNSPVIFLPEPFVRRLKIAGDDDAMMVKNFCKVLDEDPDKPKDGRNVDGTRCHKTYMSKGNRKRMYRLLFYHRKAVNEVYPILLYARNDQSELTAQQAKAINQLTDDIDAGIIVLTPLHEESS